ncbi:MAG: putative stomatin/prohibitin-family rane protease [Acidobacteriales bacterium]|nr:putative stomatin/prohibitin-family rane protease [Terriglobales bacterium]
MEMFFYFVGILIVLIIALGVVRSTFLPLQRVTIYEHQRGLKYSGGRFIGVVPPGIHWRIWKSDVIQNVDIRIVHANLQGQEIPSSDGVPVKISLSYSYSIVDLNAAFHKVDSYHTAIVMYLQIALRSVISENKIEDLLAGRGQLSTRIREQVEPKLTEIGLRLESVDVRDIMVPGELKKIFAQVLKAQKEGLAALEKARGETAALRSLANAAHMMEENPYLLRLRLLQTMSETKGNTYVVGENVGVAPARGVRRDLPSNDVAE